MKYIKYLSLIVITAAACILATTITPSTARADDYVSIGTGGITGVYYPTGGAICRLVNRGRKKHGIRCTVESTGGSIYNLNALRQGEMDLAVAQSDWQYHAYKGTSVFSDIGPFPELRSLFSLHTEAFTIVTRAGSGIDTIDELVGKRVNIGNPGSGNRATMEVLMALKGWNKGTFSVASELKGSEQPQALCDDRIDAMVYSVGHPSGAIQEVATSCDVKIISIKGPEIDKLVEENPYYAYTTIPGGMYAGNPDDVITFGAKATFVSSSKVDPELIYIVVKAVFDNFDNFKTLHPVFVNLDPRRLIKEGNTAPLHEGAKRYFKERGWIDDAGEVIGSSKIKVKQVH